MHIPVLLNEVIEQFDPQPGQSYIDVTVNGGGHASAIAKLVAPSGRVLGIDRDNDLVEQLKSRAIEGLDVAHGSYSDIKRIAKEYKMDEVDGVLFDLGLSSWHLDDAGRGFSFRANEPLDMRYDTTAGITAAEVVNTYSENQLANIIHEYGDERYARRIARSIVSIRKTERIITTDHLIQAIKGSVPPGYRNGRIHCATRTFQALRIEVNNELEALHQGLEEAHMLLKSGGRMVVISFHSLEDRRVKQFFNKKKRQGTLYINTKKPLTASRYEIVSNPRSKSAKLRSAERTPRAL